MLRKFMFVLFSPAFVFVVYDIIFYYAPIVIHNYYYISKEYIFFMFFCDFTAITSFFILIGFIKRKKIFNLRYIRCSRSISTTWYFVLFSIILLSVIYLFISVIKQIGFYQTFLEYNKFYALSRKGTYIYVYNDY